MLSLPHVGPSPAGTLLQLCQHPMGWESQMQDPTTHLHHIRAAITLLMWRYWMKGVRLREPLERLRVLVTFLMWLTQHNPP